jgi:hypothetical protein
MLGDLGNWYAPLPLLSGAELSLVCGSGTCSDGMDHAIGYMLMIYNRIDQTQVTPKPPRKQLLWNSQCDPKTKSTPSETLYLSHFTSHEFLKRIHNVKPVFGTGFLVGKNGRQLEEIPGQGEGCVDYGECGDFHQ